MFSHKNMFSQKKTCYPQKTCFHQIKCFTKIHPLTKNMFSLKHVFTSELIFTKENIFTKEPNGHKHNSGLQNCRIWLELSKMVQHYSNSRKLFKIVTQKYSTKVNNCPKWSKWSKRSKMVQNGPECFQTCPKWSKRFQKRPIWLNKVQICLFVCLFVLWLIAIIIKHIYKRYYFFQLYTLVPNKSPYFPYPVGISPGSYIQVYFLHQTGREGINRVKSGQTTKCILSN